MTTPQFLARIEQHYSKKQISEKCGIQLRTIYTWENGTEMRFSVAVHICKTLKIDIKKVIY